MKKVFPKDESFQIWKHQSPMSITQRVSLKCWTIFIYKITIIKIVNGENGKKELKKSYQKMKIFKFKKTNPLQVLPNVFLFNC